MYRVYQEPRAIAIYETSRYCVGGWGCTEAQIITDEDISTDMREQAGTISPVIELSREAVLKFLIY